MLVMYDLIEFADKHDYLKLLTIPFEIHHDLKDYRESYLRSNVTLKLVSSELLRMATLNFHQYFCLSATCRGVIHSASL